MTRDGLVMLGVAFLAGVAVGVEYMNYAAGRELPAAASDWLPLECRGVILPSCRDAGTVTSAQHPVPAAPMPAEAVTVEPRLIILTLPVTCERLPGVEDMGREHISQWGDGDLPPTLPTCVNARHYWQGVYL